MIYNPTKFCWICGRKFWGNRRYLIQEVDGIFHDVHKTCAEKERYICTQNLADGTVAKFLEGKGNPARPQNTKKGRGGDPRP